MSSHRVTIEEPGGFRRTISAEVVPNTDVALVGHQRRLEIARKAGRLADVVVNRRKLTREQKDAVVILLRECEKELMDT